MSVRAALLATSLALALAPVLPGAAQAIAQPKAAPSPLDGVWVFENKGLVGQMGGNPSSFTGTRYIPMQGGSFTECPLGYHPDKSPTLVRTMTPGGPLEFVTYYSVGGSRWDITWKANIDTSGLRITQGAFNHAMGSGAFTATRIALLPATGTLALKRGDKATLPLALSLAPPAASGKQPATVTATLSLPAGSKATLATTTLTFTATDWSQAHPVDVTCDAAERGPVVIQVALTGFPVAATQTLSVPVK